jgi:hypothetical protein
VVSFHHHLRAPVPHPPPSTMILRNARPRLQPRRKIIWHCLFQAESRTLAHCAINVDGWGSTDSREEGSKTTLHPSTLQIGRAGYCIQKPRDDVCLSLGVGYEVAIATIEIGIKKVAVKVSVGIQYNRFPTLQRFV